MANLSIEHLQKRDNLNIFLKNWKEGKKFFFVDKTIKEIPPYNEMYAEILRSAVEKKDPKALKIMRTKLMREAIPLGKLQKTVEYGSRGSGGVKNENFLKKEIEKYIGGTPMTVAFISQKKEFVIEHVVGIQATGTQTKGRKKADLNFIVADRQNPVPISIKQDNAEAWESADTAFKDVGIKLIKILLQEKLIKLMPREDGSGVKLNRVVAMYSTYNEKKATVFGSDILTGNGAVIIKTFTAGDINYNEGKNRIEVSVSHIIQHVKEIPGKTPDGAIPEPDDKRPMWVIRNAKDRTSLGEEFRGLRAEMKNAGYVSTKTAEDGRELPLIIKLSDRQKYKLIHDIIRP